MKKEHTYNKYRKAEKDKVVVSVVMPVYNASKTVATAIRSVIAQRFASWELIVLDDGSEDDTIEIVSGFKDSRIHLICCEHNFIATLNRGFAEAKGKYVARMDADDLMAPERLMVQVSIMEKRKDIDVCASWCEFFGDGIINEVFGELFGEVKDIILELLPRNKICHPTTMIRTSFWKNQKLQYREYLHAEDYKLWFEMATLGAHFYVEAQPLLYYRVSDQQTSTKYHKEQDKTANRIRWEIIEYLIKCSIEKDQLFQLYLLQRNLEEREILPFGQILKQYILIFTKLRKDL